jgi:hypothetical protein
MSFDYFFTNREIEIAKITRDKNNEPIIESITKGTCLWKEKVVNNNDAKSITSTSAYDNSLRAPTTQMQITVQLKGYDFDSNKQNYIIKCNNKYFLIDDNEPKDLLESLKYYNLYLLETNNKITWES